MIRAGAFGFIFGVAARSFLDFGWPLAAIFVFMGIVLGALAVGKGKIFALAGIFLVFAGLGSARYEMAKSSPKIFDRSVNQNVSLIAIVDEEPDERENYTRFIVKTADTEKGVRISVVANRLPSFQYGDKLKITGEIRKPENISDFDWITYLEKEGIFYEMLYPKISFISSGNGSRIKSFLFSAKDKFVSNLSELLPEPQASFMAGLTVGARKSIPKDLQNNFNIAGVSHIVALSGYNVTLVADTFMRILAFLPRYVGLSLGALGIILFAVMTGASSTVVRASLMALIVVLARFSGRLYAAGWALALAAVFMVAWNPMILRFDTSFQLSFLATVAILYVSPKVEAKLGFVTEKFNIRKILSDTASAQLLVLPLLVYKTKMLSLVSLPANLLVLPFVPATMFFGFASGILGFVSLLLATPFAWASYLFLQYEILIIKFFAWLPVSHIVF